MKKLLAVLLSASVAAAAAATAFAGTVDQSTAEPKNASTSVILSVDPTYTVTIPLSVELNEQADGTYSNDAVITATNIRLTGSKSVFVALTSDFLLENADGAPALPYEVKVGAGTAAILSGDTVASFDSNADLTLVQQSETLHFAADNPTYAGDYSDTVTFTVSVADKNNP